jgi:restriction system protein
VARTRRGRQSKQKESTGILSVLLVIAVWVGAQHPNWLSAIVLASLLLLGSYIGVRIWLEVRRHNRFKRSGIAQIDAMEGRQFEVYLECLFKAQGYSVRLTQESGDFGADLIISKAKVKAVVQAKRYSNNVGLEAVQQAHTAISHYSAQEAWVVTNSFFTQPAKTLAASTGVTLIDRPQLISMMLKMNSVTEALPQATLPNTLLKPSSKPLGSTQDVHALGMTLLCITGPYKGQCFGLRHEPISIGRSSDCGISLGTDSSISRYHARVMCHNGSHLISDTSSANGTLVNGQRISTVMPLVIGDVIQIGETQFRCESG